MSTEKKVNDSLKQWQRKSARKDVSMILALILLFLATLALGFYSLASLKWGGCGQISLVFYDEHFVLRNRFSRLPEWWPRWKRIVFLAGPTTSNKQENRIRIKLGYELSTWRGYFINFLENNLVSFPDLVLVVPEFSDFEASFKDLAEKYFGNTTVPKGIPCKPVGWGVLQWEREWLRKSDRIVCWCDFRETQPGLGLNARPEIAELIAEYPHRVVLGISQESVGAMTRFWAAAREKGLAVHRTVEEVAKAAVK